MPICTDYICEHQVYTCTYRFEYKHQRHENKAMYTDMKRKTITCQTSDTCSTYYVSSPVVFNAATYLTFSCFSTNCVNDLYTVVCSLFSSFYISGICSFAIFLLLCIFFFSYIKLLCTEPIYFLSDK